MSLFHANIVAFAVNRLKAKEVLPRGMLVLPMVNIDDAIIAFQFTTLLKESEKAIAKVLYIELIKVYPELGFKISLAKTVVATNKGTFLNIDFIDGSIVVLPLKTAMLVFRAVDKRFSETSSVVEEIFNMAQGAMAKGGCPITLYVHGLAKTLRRIFRFVPDSKSFSPIELTMSFFDARSLSGWGVPSLATFLSKESTSVFNDSVLLVKAISKLAEGSKAGTPLTKTSHESAAALFNALFPPSFDRPSDHHCGDFLAHPSQFMFKVSKTLRAS